jgi:hypothetical protein
VSRSREIEPFHAPQGLHLALSVLLPAAGAGLLGYLAFAPWPWAVWLVGLGLGVCLGFWAQWRVFTRQDPLVRFWLWLSLQVVAMLVLWATAGPWWWGWGLAVAVQGHLTVMFQTELAPRARLFYKLEGYADGPGLEARVHEFQLDADFSVANRRTIVSLLGSLAAVVAAVAAALPRGHTGWGIAAVVVFLATCLGFAALTGLWRREMESLMYGRRLPVGDLLRPLTAVAALAAVAGLLAWALVAFVPPLVNWNALLEGKPRVALQEPPPPAVYPLDFESGPNGDPFPALIVQFWLRVLHTERLVRLVDLAFQVGAVAVPLGLLWWALRPVFRLLGPDRERRPGLWKRWWRLLRLQLRHFWRRLLALGRTLAAESSPARALAPGGSTRWLAQFTGKARGARGRYPELVEAFVSLLDWAEPEVVYRTGETTGVWCSRVAEAFPLHATSLAEVSGLLERDLFSDRPLNKAQRLHFLAAVRAIVVSSKHEPGPR